MIFRKPLRCATYALALLLSACGGGGGGGSPASGGTAREYTREDGDVTVTPNVGFPATYTAAQTITISNDDAGATRVVSAWQNTMGSIISSAGLDGGYQVHVSLTATAPSEEQARALLQTMHVSHRDGVGGGTLYLEHEIRADHVSGNGISRGAGIALSLPPLAGHQLYQAATNDDAASTGLGGPLAHIASVNGNVTLSGDWDDAVAETTNGSVDVTVAAAVGAGYDLEGQTTNGTTTIAVAGTSPVGEQTEEHKRYRSPDYSSSNPKVDVRGYAVNGDVAIHD